MTSTVREVLFFGSVAATVVGYEVKDSSCIAAAEKQGLAISLHVTATAPYARVEEVLGSVATSSAAPLAICKTSTASSSPRSTYTTAAATDTATQTAVFLPVMLELARDAAADDVGLTEEHTDAASAAVEGEGNSSSPGYHSLDLAVTVQGHQGLQQQRSVLLAVKRLFIPSAKRYVTEDLCTILRVRVPVKAIRNAIAPTPSSTSGKQAVAKDEGEGEVSEADSALLVDVMVRVVSLAERVAAAMEAEQGLHELLGTQSRSPRLSMDLAVKVRLPYGSMPLHELYRHYSLFYSQYYCRPVKQRAELVALLLKADSEEEEGEEELEEEASVVDHSGSVRKKRKGASGKDKGNDSNNSNNNINGAAGMTFPYRCNGLTVVRLDRVLLGDEAFAPLLLTFAHCSNLRQFIADRNELGNITCARLCALFSRHRYLHTVSLAHNRIYEGGAELLLRLARRNHRIIRVDMQDNPCSEATLRRIAQVTRANSESIQHDTLNVFTSQYSYLTSPSSIPFSSLKEALGVWAMLSAAPVGDVDVWVRNSTTEAMDAYEDCSAPLRQQRAAEVAGANSLIPPAARAPLLNEIARTVSVGIARVVPDPLVRSIFTDVEGVQAQQNQRREEREAEMRYLPPNVQLAVRMQQQRAEGSGLSDEEEIYSNSFLRLIVTTLRGIATDTDWVKVAEVLKGIGRRQQAMGAAPEDYWLAVHVLMKSLYVTCGAEDMPYDTVAAFLMVLALGIRTAVGEEMQM